MEKVANDLGETPVTEERFHIIARLEMAYNNFFELLYNPDLQEEEGFILAKTPQENEAYLMGFKAAIREVREMENIQYD
jgi:hypothetical protein